MSRKRRNFASVNQLERHIEILLLSNDCVIVPGLGGFMAHHVDARYDMEDAMFLPPLRTIGFNPQLKLNDHLLVQSYIEANDISYPEALRCIECEVEELKQHLETQGEYELNGIGTLQLNEEGKIEFSPCEAGVLTPSLYGLNSFEMPQLAQQPATVSIPNEEQDKEIQETEDEVVEESTNTEEMEAAEEPEAITIRMSWVRNAIAAAVAIIAFFIIGTPVGYDEYHGMNVQESSILPVITTPTSTQDSVTSKDIAIAEKDTEANLEKNQDKEDFSKVSANQKNQDSEEVYTIVLASQTTRRNAEIFIETLNCRQFNKASIKDMNGTSLVRVIYDIFPTEQEAFNQLRQLRKKSEYFEDAWVLKIKK